jgi:hypothetical protein
MRVSLPSERFVAAGNRRHTDIMWGKYNPWTGERENSREANFMWRLKYLVCLVSHHNWIGFRYRYCLRCGKLEITSQDQPDIYKKLIEKGAVSSEI